MSSTFDAKIEALLDKVPHRQSAMETPWKKTLFWAVFWVVAIAVIAQAAIVGALTGLFKKTEIEDLYFVEENLDRFGRKPSELFYGWYANDATVFSDMQQEEEKNSY